MRENYETIDHTADIGVKAWGDSVPQAFEVAGYAMFDIITDAESIEPVISKEIVCEADNLEQLLVDWLSELLFVLEVEGLLFNRFEVSIDSTGKEGEMKRLVATVQGEEMDLKKHVLKTEIKAITYHMLEVNEEENYVVVLFDL